MIRGLESETDILLFFLPMTLKMINYHSSVLLFLTFYVAHNELLRTSFGDFHGA